MRYNQSVARLCERMNERGYGSLKTNGQYRMEWRGDTLRLYHYGTNLGGVRFTPEGVRIVLGFPLGTSDKCALNTVWRYFRTGRRIHMDADDTYHIEIVNECCDNAPM